MIHVQRYKKSLKYLVSKIFTFIVTSFVGLIIHCTIMIRSFVNDFADFDSKISFIMFLHDNILACEISTVRTLALSSNSRNV